MKQQAIHSRYASTKAQVIVYQKFRGKAQGTGHRAQGTGHRAQGERTASGGSACGKNTQTSSLTRLISCTLLFTLVFM
ncbi:MAG: hypothetical protein IPI69_13265 [Bacteroidales bacterium]|nr:hypothetical protein [Bacteroidales bacterium]